MMFGMIWNEEKRLSPPPPSKGSSKASHLSSRRLEEEWEVQTNKNQGETEEENR